MKFKSKFTTAVILATQIATGSVFAQSSDEIQELKKQIDELTQKVKILERNREIDKETSDEEKKKAPAIIAGQDGFTFRTGDTNFAVGIHGVLQVDNRTFFHDNGVKGNDGFLIRRARPIISGTVYRDFDFVFVPDFGGTSVQIFDAYLNYRYAPWLQLIAGKFKSPVGLEQLQADRDILFNERSLVTSLVPNRDVGFELHGDIADATVSYAVGIFNGVGDARNSTNVDVDDDREFAGRLFFQPFRRSDWNAVKGFGFGVAGTYTSTFNSAGLPNTTGGTLPGYVTDGQQQFFAYNPATVGGKTPVVAASGEHWRLSPQGYYFWGPLGLMGEYAISDQAVRRTVAAPLTSADLQNTGWEVTGSWVLTGEDASFTGVTPTRVFDPRENHWGALQLVGRYAELNLDRHAFPLFSNPKVSASGAQSWAAGLNWYLNRNIKLAASFSHTTFSGNSTGGTSSPGIVTHQPENVFFTRLQLAF